LANEFAFVPLHWRLPLTRALGRATRGAAVKEYGRFIENLVAETDAPLFLAFKGTFVPPETVRRLRARGVLTICHYPDVSSTAHGPWLRNNLREYDWVFTAKTFGPADMEKQCGVTRASVLLHGFDPEVHRPLPSGWFERARYDCDVSFIGTWHQPKERLLACLQRSLPRLRLRVWGGQWENCSDPTLQYAVARHSVTGRSYAAAIQSSTINLAILSGRVMGASQGDQVTSRTFHIPAAGGLMLHERTAEFLDLFEDGSEALTFGDEAELCDVVGRVLGGNLDVRAVRAMGMRKVWGRDSWDHRMAEMLNHAAFDSLRAP
jgi:spore maturation protein CgeB